MFFLFESHSSSNIHSYKDRKNRIQKSTMRMIPILPRPFNLNWIHKIRYSPEIKAQTIRLDKIWGLFFSLIQSSQTVQVLNNFLFFVLSIRFTIWKSFLRKQMGKKKNMKIKCVQVINRILIFLQHTVPLAISGKVYFVLGESSDFASIRESSYPSTLELSGSFNCWYVHPDLDKNVFIFYI